MNQDTLIEQAAREFATIDTDTVNGDEEIGFKGGATWATQTPELYRGLLVEFLEFIDGNYWNEPDISFEKPWREAGTENRYTLEELVTIFIQHKQESNGTR